MDLFFGCEPFVRPDVPTKPDHPSWQKSIIDAEKWFEIMKMDEEIPLPPWCRP